MLLVSIKKRLFNTTDIPTHAAAPALESARNETLTASSNLHPSWPTRVTLGVSTLPAAVKTPNGAAAFTFAVVLLSSKTQEPTTASESPLYVHFQWQLDATIRVLGSTSNAHGSHNKHGEVRS